MTLPYQSANGLYSSIFAGPGLRTIKQSPSISQLLRLLPPFPLPLLCWRCQEHRACTCIDSIFGGRPADCCDGTDEPRGTCKQTCAEQGRASRERLLAAAKDAAAGNKVGPVPCHRIRGATHACSDVRARRPADPASGAAGLRILEMVLQSVPALQRGMVTENRNSRS